MTAHPIDRARARFEDYIEEGLGYEPSRGEAMAVLDALEQAEARIKAVERLTYASDDGTEYEHNHGTLDDCGDDCPACWVQTIRRALDGDA